MRSRKDALGASRPKPRTVCLRQGQLSRRPDPVRKDSAGNGSECLLHQTVRNNSRLFHGGGGDAQGKKLTLHSPV
jgi:hypothetical protein